jgi:O-methyltransferase involved in polyketide biosynthesis
MELPRELRWVEVDLPDLLDYKEEVLAGETPRCRLERVRLDLSDVAARQALFARLGAESRRAVVITEGLLIYLEREQVEALARDLGAVDAFQRWLMDIASPGLLARMKRSAGRQVAAADAPFKFAPPEGPDFYRPLGWTPLVVRSFLAEAKRLRRLPLLLRFFAMFPEPKGPAGNRPWAAICLLGRNGPPAPPS